MKNRRKVRQMAKVKECQKNMRGKGRHRPNSLSPKDNCKSTTTAPKKKRRTRCKNCGLLHASGECQWPAFNSQQVKSRRKTKKEKQIEEELAKCADLIDLLD